MLTHRIIPTLLYKHGQMVKGRQFSADRVVGVIEQSMRVHTARGADELILLDVAATPEGRGPDFDLIARLSESCYCPLTVGGGVRSVEDVRGLLRAGADKVAIGTRASFPPNLQALADQFGSQAIVASLDVLDCHVTRECGKVTTSIIDPPAVANWMERCGAGEILLTSIDREGMMEGYDLALIESVSRAVNIPVIAHGGCGTPEHMVEAIRAGASACAAGAMFCFSDVTPRDCAKHLRECGIEARV